MSLVLAMKPDRSSTSHALRIFRKQSPVQVLGPGKRAVIWVQGCPFACAGCIVPESWDARGGEVVNIEDLCQWIQSQPDLEGITLSGGEPMLQAGALVELIDRLHTKTKTETNTNLGVVCYTGYTLEALQQQGTPEQLALLQRIDLLIDGQFIAAQQGDLLWRGSANQRLLPLSHRYRDLLPQTTDQASPSAFSDRSAGIELGMDETGTVFFSGVPPQADFRQRFEAGLRQRGILLPTT
ncbi:MAG: 4Fe-4S single cluster domain-containing protein [Prochlorotrichaceae cyanobacterium]